MQRLVDKCPIEEGNFYIKNFRRCVQFQEDPCAEPIEDDVADWKMKEHHIDTFTFSDAVTDDEDRTCQDIGFQPCLVTEHSTEAVLMPALA
jgi:hypothetical protein